MTVQDQPLGTQFFERGVRATGAVTIQRSAADLYQVWHEFTELPRFIDELERVERTDERTTEWHVKHPSGSRYSWKAEIINDVPGRVIAWRTTEGADVASAGSVTFRELPYSRGTEVKAIMEYLPPAGSVGDAISKALGGDPKLLLRRGLFRFRQLMETGEIATSTGQPVGANKSRSDRPGEEPRRTDTELRDLASTTSEALS